MSLLIGVVVRGSLVVFFIVVGLTGSITLAGQAQSGSVPGAPGEIEYRVLATNKTSTMEKELNEAAEAGFKFQAVMGGDTAIGGSEVVSVMSRSGSANGRYAYKLLATSRTSTMQKELNEAADAGFEYRDQTVFKSTFGGEEVVGILERDKDAVAQLWEVQAHGDLKDGDSAEGAS